MVQRNNNALKHFSNFLTPKGIVALLISSILPFALVKNFSKKTNDQILKVNTPLQASLANPVLPESYELSLTQHILNTLNRVEAPNMIEVEGMALLPLYYSPDSDYNSLNENLIPSFKPENAAFVISNTSSKENASKPAVPQENWKTIKTREKDSLGKIFNRMGLSNALLHEVMKDVPQVKTFNLKTNQEIKYVSSKNKLEKICFPLSPTKSLLVYKENKRYKSLVHTQKTNTYKRFLNATVQGSLYTTAKKNNIPFALLKQMSELFSTEVNFKRDVKQGDQFTIIYQAIYLKDKFVSTGDILAAAYKTKSKTFQAFRYTTKAGHTEYYNAEGASLKKAFDRYPLNFTHISSTFSNNRYHPILRYKKPHRGIDLAAPMGTLIRATGDGRISTIGRQNGYGNTIKIKHSKSHTTIYGHLLRFQKGISKGSFVKRGQVIGYVGQSGLATGPHCHYEFRINNEPKNPTTIGLPQGHPIPIKELSAFKGVKNLMLAELQSFEKTQLAKR